MNNVIKKIESLIEETLTDNQKLALGTTASFIPAAGIVGHSLYQGNRAASINRNALSADEQTNQSYLNLLKKLDTNEISQEQFDSSLQGMNNIVSSIGSV